MDNFNTSMKPHYDQEIRSSIDDVRRSENTLNNHSKSLAKILQLGKECNQRALMVFQSSIPAMQGLRKDHKGGYDPVKGPALRPLINGRIGPNAVLANVLARFLRTVRPGLYEAGYNTEVISTEELLHYITLENEKLGDDIQREQPRRGCRPPSFQSPEI